MLSRFHKKQEDRAGRDNPATRIRLVQLTDAPADMQLRLNHQAPASQVTAPSNASQQPMKPAPTRCKQNRLPATTAENSEWHWLIVANAQSAPRPPHGPKTARHGNRPHTRFPCLALLRRHHCQHQRQYSSPGGTCDQEGGCRTGPDHSSLDCQEESHSGAMMRFAAAALPALNLLVGNGRRSPLSSST